MSKPLILNSGRLSEAQVGNTIELPGPLTMDPGYAKNNQTPFLQVSDLLSDFIVSGLSLPVPTTASLSSTLTPGIAYALGHRVTVGTSTAFTFTPSTDNYLDLSTSGQLNLVSVINNAAPPSVTVNSTRIYKIVTSGTSITTISQFLSTSPSSNIAAPNLKLNNQSNNIYQYTAQLSDVNSMIVMNFTQANTLYFQPAIVTPFEIGSTVAIVQMGSGGTSIAGVNGVTVYSPSTLTLRSQYSTATMFLIATNSWIITGDLA